MNIKIIFVLLVLSNHFGCKQSNELNLNFERIHQSKIDEWKTSGFNIVIDSLNP